MIDDLTKKTFALVPTSGGTNLAGRSLLNFFAPKYSPQCHNNTFISYNREVKVKNLTEI